MARPRRDDYKRKPFTTYIRLDYIERLYQIKSERGLDKNGRMTDIFVLVEEALADFMKKNPPKRR